jgi:hypothetical protein
MSATNVEPTEAGTTIPLTDDEFSVLMWALRQQRAAQPDTPADAPLNNELARLDAKLSAGWTAIQAAASATTTPVPASRPEVTR